MMALRTNRDKNKRFFNQRQTARLPIDVNKSGVGGPQMNQFEKLCLRGGSLHAVEVEDRLESRLGGVLCDLSHGRP